MKKFVRTLLPAAAVCAAVAAMTGASAGAASPATATYQADLAPVALNTPAGAATGQVTIQLNGDQATVTEKVSGLADKLPTDTATLASLGIPAAFAGASFPHVQHIHIGGKGTCPDSAADSNGDGVISTTEGGPAYGMVSTTLSMSGSTDASAATDVTVAPSGGSFSYTRTFTMNAETLAAIQAGSAVIVVHGLNPSSAPAASLTTPNSLGVTLPGADKPLALIATAPALCGTLTQVAITSPTTVPPATELSTTAPQMKAMPAGGVQTGGGSTSGFHDEGLLVLGILLIAGSAFVLIARRQVLTRR